MTKLPHIEDVLRERHVALTPQRRSIASYLQGNRDHPTAAQIFRAVTRDFPITSRATVYNTLALLKDQGLVQEVVVAPGESRFDPNPTPHHHFRCSSCGRVSDMPGARVEVEVDPASGFVVSGCSVVIHGSCPECAAG